MTTTTTDKAITMLDEEDKQKSKTVLTNEELRNSIIAGKLFPRVYELFYRYDTTRPLSKSFCFNGPLSEAIKRGRDHCRFMGCRFICVRPDIVDLDIQEEDKKQNPSYQDDRF